MNSGKTEMSLALWNFCFFFSSRAAVRASSAEGSEAHPHGEHKGECAAESMTHVTVMGPVKRPLASMGEPGSKRLDINKAITLKIRLIEPTQRKH